MVPFFTTTLVVSIAAMAAILWLKRYELKSGRVFLSGARPRMEAFFAGALYWLERVLPALAAAQAKRAWLAGRTALRTWAARAIIGAEHLLERGLHALRRATTHAPQANGAASPFLREVAEHKKKLLEDREE